MKDNVLEGVLGEVHLRSTNPPDVEDMATRHLEGRCMGGRVEILARSRMSGDDPRKLVHEVDPCSIVKESSIKVTN
jgi:hypothetical protein